jgi:hypothetical protein
MFRDFAYKTSCFILRGNLAKDIFKFGSKTLYIQSCVFEKRSVKVWNLLGNSF